jgi:putative tricarboxylic transport membrane protein
MSSFDSLIDGFASALTLSNLGFGLLGTFLGTLVGVLPGIGPALAIALLLPITYTVSPASALIMFAAIYYGAMYGGSTTSILLNTPGESGSVITALEGNKMARRGRAGAALATAAIGSFVAGTIATAILAFTAPSIADLAIQVGAADYVALMLVAFTTVSSLLGASQIRGFIALSVGLVLGLIGADLQSGLSRLTFGNQAVSTTNSYNYYSTNYNELLFLSSSGGGQGGTLVIPVGVVTANSVWNVNQQVGFKWANLSNANVTVVSIGGGPYTAVTITMYAR